MQHTDEIIGYIGIFFTVFLGATSQIIVKWQVNLAGDFPRDSFGQIAFLTGLLLNPWIIVSLFLTLFAGVSWMVAMSKFDISFAYPYVSLIYVFMMIAGVVLFGESLNPHKLLGTTVVVIGILIVSRGHP
jgi:drug/metabolite transporter (DMT)-like permease